MCIASLRAVWTVLKSASNDLNVEGSVRQVRQHRRVRRADGKLELVVLEYRLFAVQPKAQGFGAEADGAKAFGIARAA